MFRLQSRFAGLPDAAQRTTARRQLFESGYCRLPQLIDADLLGQLRTEADRLTDALHDEVEGTVISRDRAGRVLSMHYLDRHSELLFDLSRQPEIISLAEDLLEARCVPFLTEYFAKPAARAEATPPHQDQIFYRDHFGDELAVAFWIALTDVPEGSGVLQYAWPQAAPGELWRHRVSDVQNFGAELVDVAGLSFTAVPVGAGDAVVHHSFAVHRSGPMRNQAPRAAFALNFRRSPYRQRVDPWERSAG